MTELLRDVTGVIEDLRTLDSDRDSLLDRGVRVLVSGIGIESPRVCIQRPHILARSNLLLRNLQRMGRAGGIAGIHQNQVER